jgi:hypothetical protein
VPGVDSVRLPSAQDLANQAFPLMILRQIPQAIDHKTMTHVGISCAFPLKKGAHVDSSSAAGQEIRVRSVGMTLHFCNGPHPRRRRYHPPPQMKCHPDRSEAYWRDLLWFFWLSRRLDHGSFEVCISALCRVLTQTLSPLVLMAVVLQSVSRYFAVHPPSINISVPVINPASSEHR